MSHVREHMLGERLSSLLNMTFYIYFGGTNSIAGAFLHAVQFSVKIREEYSAGTRVLVSQRHGKSSLQVSMGVWTFQIFMPLGQYLLISISEIVTVQVQKVDIISTNLVHLDSEIAPIIIF